MRGEPTNHTEDEDESQTHTSKTIPLSQKKNSGRGNHKGKKLKKRTPKIIRQIQIIRKLSGTILSNL